MLPYEHMNSLLFRNDVQGTNLNQKTPKKLLNNVYKEFHAWSESVSKSQVIKFLIFEQEKLKYERRTKVNPQNSLEAQCVKSHRI